MKSFIIFTIVVSVACANTVGRAGWAPHTPTVDLELVAGVSGTHSAQAAAGQELLEQAIGTGELPGQITSANGVDAFILQEEDINQLTIVNKPSGASTTINLADTENEAEAGDALDAVISAGVSASLINSAQSEASGQGAFGIEGSTLNLSETRK